ncbi:paraquat-inducible protein A [Arcobacter sp. YIC-80]|uniref:paraquat-inducible protein A n=1 Tax=unclassified Arcobacter TaxID=2593671 RepID=UPI00384A9729
MSIDTKNIVECYGCGLFVEKRKKTWDKKIKCPRCSSKLSIENNHSLDSLFYAISALLLFVLLNIYPLISLDINNSHLKSTLYDTILTLFEQNLFFVALIVFFTIFLAPVLNSIIIIFSFIQIHTNIKLFTNTLLHDSLNFFKHWGFIEVFIISVIVTYIKLVGMADSTRFDLGFYVMLLYLFCLYMSNIKFDGREVFEE